MKLVVALVGLVAACGGEQPPARDGALSAPRRVAVVAAIRRPVERTLEVSGTVRGRNTAILTSRIVAGLREVRVSAGDRVSAGQLLALLEDADAQAGVRRARAELMAATEGRAGAEQTARAADVAARVAATAHTRTTFLLSKGAATQQAYDDAEGRQQSTSAERDLAAARVRGSSARIDEARAALGAAEAMLAYTRITAPFAGRVIDRRADPGSQAAPGVPLLVVEQEGPLRVEAAIDESYVSALAVGATAHVALESAGREAEGRVTEVVPALDPISRAFLVKIGLPAPDAPGTPGPLRPGMFARVRFPIGVEDRLMVPVTAIRSLGDLDRLFVVEDGRARLRLVTLGQRQDGSVEVLAGLDSGEVVVLVPPGDLLDGAAIEAAR